MNHDVIITCALTGAGDTTAKSPHVPVTPKQIAAAAVESARQWLKDHPQDKQRWLEGVTTFDGKPAAENLKLTSN